MNYASCPLVDLILRQHGSFLHDAIDSQSIILKRLSQAKHQSQVDATQSILTHLPPTLCRAIKYCQEKGASSWLSALPIKQYGFALHKAEFTDALRLCYGSPSLSLCLRQSVFDFRCFKLPSCSGEVLQYKSAVLDDDTRVDIRVAGFWGCRHHHSFFDVRVFNAFADSNQCSR